MSLKKYFSESFEIEPEREELVLEKCILWPSVIEYVGEKKICGAQKFPNIGDIKIRYGKDFNVEPLTCFVETLRESRNRILIVDPYLFEERDGFAQIRVDQVLDWFFREIEATDIRLLTNKLGDQVEESVRNQFDELASDTAEQLGKEVRVQVKFSLSTYFPYVHDRFAIIDNELWHFGATVGGLHHQVSAVTRGWRANDYEAQEFFDLAWRGDNDYIHQKKKNKQ